MKGKLYNSKNSLRLAQLASPTNGYPLISQKNSVKDYISIRSRTKSPIRYFWKSSIPDSWKKIVAKDNFIQFRNQNGKKRNTLAFLQETQKYIHSIRNPVSPIITEEIEKTNIGSYIPRSRRAAHTPRLLSPTLQTEPDLRIFTEPTGGSRVPRKSKPSTTQKFSLESVRSALRSSKRRLNTVVDNSVQEFPVIHRKN